MNKAEFQKRYGNSIGKPKLSLLLGEAKTPFEAAKLAVGWRFLARKMWGRVKPCCYCPALEPVPAA